MRPNLAFSKGFIYKHICLCAQFILPRLDEMTTKALSEQPGRYSLYSHCRCHRRYDNKMMSAVITIDVLLLSSSVKHDRNISIKPPSRVDNLQATLLGIITIPTRGGKFNRPLGFVSFFFKSFWIESYNTLRFVSFFLQVFDYCLQPMAGPWSSLVEGYE